VGPLKIRVKFPARAVRLLVSEREAGVDVADDWTSFEVPSVADHEVAVIGLRD